MAREPDMVVRLVGDGEQADQVVGVVGDQVLTATPGDVGKVVTVAADGSLVLAAGGGGGLSGAWASVAVVIRDGTGDYSTTSMTKTPIDSTNLGFQTVTLAVGDKVRCQLYGSCEHASDSGGVAFDFEVDRPASANVYMANNADFGVFSIDTPPNAITYNAAVSAVGSFTATEAGVHGFRPVWRTNAGTARLLNAASGSSDVLIQFLVDVSRA